MIARILFLVFLLVAVFFSASSAGDTLIPGQPLLDVADATLVSAGETFELGFFSPDANSTNRYLGIWYHSLSPQTVVWVANRERPVAGRTGRLSLYPNGTLLVTDGGNSSTTVWSSSSGSLALASPVARLLDTGNFVVGEEMTSSPPAWESFGFPTDTLLPGMQLGVNTTSGLRTNITSWRSATDPASGDYTLGIDWHGVPQQMLWRAGQKYWRAGPWNGLYITGAPQMDTENLLQYQISVDSSEFILSYTVSNPSVAVRITINSSGLNEILTWVDERQGWNVRGYVPLDPCDNYARCGPNGVCSPAMSPLCRCLPKFHPANPRNWDLFRDWSGGCMRDTDLDCRNATDGFIKQTGLKLPDTSTATVDESLSTLDDCRSWCLTNCSCTAYARANFSGGGGGSGCIIWTSPPTDMKFFPDSGTGQDLYVRLAAADVIAVSESNHSNRNRLGIIIGSSCAAIFLLAFGLILWKTRRKHHVPEEATEGEDLDLPLFDLKSVEDATDNFSIANKLGEGGYGPVYRGKLSEDQEMAVKRLSKTSTQGVDEFKNEVMSIAKLQHRNLVRLLGCCIQAGERMLIYEYLPNGSLDTFLFDKDKRELVDWKSRYNIILGIARGLLYLHHDSRYRIVHRDLKASNILLDKDMNPKISDFGMARIFGGDETMRNTTRVVGTYGYMSPEYAMDGIFSVKSDVFSFGVLVLEIMWSLWKEHKSLELVDESIAQLFVTDEVLRCIKVGLLCVQEQPEDRPTMSAVLLMLNSNSSLLPEPKPPGFVITKEISKTETSTSKGDSLSRNHVSITTLEGR
ncbi:hypothetical protein ZIOFF_065287 [Zingiber officinale]|uniref:Receptor-like serine/threonine-protein kinase n=1 Tax=Zingiber officinale TaxID=94328 RepID=A0A8J5EZV0_ZINOF|nr:hypothetical protein ZIOFF_065287 [Zingiber officinale]